MKSFNPININVRPPLVYLRVVSNPVSPLNESYWFFIAEVFSPLMDCIEIHSALCFLLCVHKHGRALITAWACRFTVNLITDKNLNKISTIESVVACYVNEIWSLRKRKHRAWKRRFIQAVRDELGSHIEAVSERVSRFLIKNHIPVETVSHLFPGVTQLQLFQRSEASRSGSTDIQHVASCSAAGERCYFKKNRVETVATRWGRRERRPFGASPLTCLCLSSSISRFTGNISSRSRLLFCVWIWSQREIWRDAHQHF